MKVALGVAVEGAVVKWTEVNPFPSAGAGADPAAEMWALNPAETPQEPLTPDRGFGYWVDLIRYRVEHDWDAVVVVTGEEGSGKSTLALRFCYALDPKWDAENLCYDGKDVLAAYERIQRSGKRGVPILYDEGARGLLAGETMDREQRAIVRSLMLVREIGAVLIICSPDIWRIANAVRGRRATLWLHITERGRALAHERDYRLRYKQDSRSLRLTVSPTAPNVTWRPFKEGDTRFRRYRKVKTSRLASFLAETKGSLARTPAQKVERARLSNAERQARWRARHKGEKAHSAPTQKETGGDLSD